MISFFPNSLLQNIISELLIIFWNNWSLYIKSFFENGAPSDNSEINTTLESQDRQLIQIDYVYPIDKDTQFEAGYRGTDNKRVVDFEVKIFEPDVNIIAVQGPKSFKLMEKVFGQKNIHLVGYSDGCNIVREIAFCLSEEQQDWSSKVSITLIDPEIPLAIESDLHIVTLKLDIVRAKILPVMNISSAHCHFPQRIYEIDH